MHAHVIGRALLYNVVFQCICTLTSMGTAGGGGLSDSVWRILHEKFKWLVFYIIYVCTTNPKPGETIPVPACSGTHNNIL